MTSTPEDLAKGIKDAPEGSNEFPDVSEILFGCEEPPPFEENNIFPIEWHSDTPKLMRVYDAARRPTWTPADFDWDSLNPEDFSMDQRYAISYWFALLSVFDSSAPAVFARAMVHTYETHVEDPVRKCFFTIVRDEVHHEEICQRVIQKLTPPGGFLDFAPETDLGRLAQNNVHWYYHNGSRYWSGFKDSVHKHSLEILFTSFMMGEVAAGTLFQQMHQKTTIPVLKDAFAHVGQDEARHLRICLALLENLLPNITDEQREMITKQIRAGFVFLSGILFEPPEQFWELPKTWIPAHRILEQQAREGGLGILSLEERRENWRTALLRVKGLLEPHGVEFPAIPEVGIDGKTVAFDPNDIVPVF